MTRKEYYDKQRELSQELEREYQESNRDEVKAKADAEVAGHAAIKARMKYCSEELLNCDDFERYIGVGTSMEDLKIIFLSSDYQMDKFCRDNYGMDFKTTYNFLLNIALADYKDTIKDLASVGNATAMNILSQLVLNRSEQNMNINIIGSIPTEKNDDSK